MILDSGLLFLGHPVNAFKGFHSSKKVIKHCLAYSLHACILLVVLQRRDLDTEDRQVPFLCFWSPWLSSASSPWFFWSEFSTGWPENACPVPRGFRRASASAPAICIRPTTSADPRPGWPFLLLSHPLNAELKLEGGRMSRPRHWFSV